MADTLSTHFVDGGDVHVQFIFDERRVEIKATDYKTLKRYSLIFADCPSITVTYSDVELEWAGLSDLNDGIQELEALNNGVRRFKIEFSDESILEIQCRQFTMMIDPMQDV